MFCIEKTTFYVTDAINNIQGAVGNRETGESAAHVAEQSQTTILLYMFCTAKTTFYVTDALNNIQVAVGKRETGEYIAHMIGQSQTTISLYKSAYSAK